MWNFTIEFLFVEYSLRQRNVCVSVVGAMSMERLEAGWVLGGWSIGQKDGCCIGAICWLTEDAHAAPLTGNFFTMLTPFASVDNIIAQWDCGKLVHQQRSQSGEHI